MPHFTLYFNTRNFLHIQAAQKLHDFNPVMPDPHTLHW